MALLFLFCETITFFSKQFLIMSIFYDLHLNSADCNAICPENIYVRTGRNDIPHSQKQTCLVFPSYFRVKILPQKTITELIQFLKKKL